MRGGDIAGGRGDFVMYMKFGPFGGSGEGVFCLGGGWSGGVGSIVGR